MDYKYNKLFFDPISDRNFAPGILLIILGAFITIIAIALFQEGKVGGGVILLIIIPGLVYLGIFLLKNAIKFNSNKEIVTAYHLDKACEDHLKNLKLMALKKLGIDEDEVKEAEPIYFHYYYWDDIPDSTVRWHKDKDCDDLYRSSHYNAVMFLFSKDQVFCYNYRFSNIEERKQEITNEFFYNDIVSVTTESQVKKHASSSAVVKYEYFKLTTSGATSIDAMVLVGESTERSINAMKSLFRSKKATIAKK